MTDFINFLIFFLKKNEKISGRFAIIGRKTSLDSFQLPFPPVISAIRLFDYSDPIPLPKRQIALPLACKFVQRRNP